MSEGLRNESTTKDAANRNPTDKWNAATDAKSELKRSKSNLAASYRRFLKELTAFKDTYTKLETTQRSGQLT